MIRFCKCVKLFYSFFTSNEQISHWMFIFSHVCMRDRVCVDGHEVDVQYSNWASGDPDTVFYCVIVTQFNKWFTAICDYRLKFVCQS